MVPKDQIIDTVELFRYERQRKISLRFLAHHLLRTQIQAETHNSIEDAKTALDLYMKYLELKENGQFENVLAQIYQIGRQTNWQTPEDMRNNNRNADLEQSFQALNI